MTSKTIKQEELQGALDLPPDLLETVSEAVFDWDGEHGEGGGRPFWNHATKLVLEVLAEHAQIIPKDAPEAAQAPAMPPPVADFGPVRLELMGHRYREGHLSEVVIAGQPFLKLQPRDGAPEFYTPSSVYCMSPVTASSAPVQRAAIPAHFAEVDVDDEDGGPF